MRNLIYWVHTSVDGFVNGPNGEFDWARMGPELSAYSDALNERVDTLLYGRPVWEMMVGYWPTADTDSPDPHSNRFAPFWRATPKIVFSHTYEGDDWTARVIRDDLRAEVTALKAAPGRDLLLVMPTGSGNTVTLSLLARPCKASLHQLNFFIPSRGIAGDWSCISRAFSFSVSREMRSFALSPEGNAGSW